MEYIKEYSKLNSKEHRQLGYKRRYKLELPTWDDSMVLLTQLVKEKMVRHMDVLDFGCGHGNFVIDELGDAFTNKTGYDVVPEAISGNRSVGRIIIGNGKELPFETASFDIIISLWTLEHVENPAVIFKDALRVLRSNGLLAFVTPNKHSLLILLRRLISQKIANPLLELFYGRKDSDVFPVYYRANSVSDIKRLARETGFIVECLMENSDPSYTSFGPISYFFSKWFSSLGITASKPHIIAVLRKLS